MIYNPDLNKLDNLKYQMELQADASFANVFKNNCTPDVKKDLKKKTDADVQENHNVLCIYGLTGKGKSISGISQIREVFPNFKVNKIFFHNQEILNALNTDMERPDWIVRDENIDFAQYGTGTNRIKSQLEAVTHTLRKRCISFTFISAPLFKLETAQYYFRALDMDRKLRITRFGVQDPLTFRYIGAYYQKVMTELDPFWLEYNRRKEEFMQSIMSGDFSKGKPEHEKMIDLILKELDLAVYTKKKERKLYIATKFTNLTRGEIEDLSTLLEIRLKGINEEQKEDAESPDEGSEFASEL